MNNCNVKLHLWDFIQKVKIYSFMEYFLENVLFSMQLKHSLTQTWSHAVWSTVCEKKTHIT